MRLTLALSSYLTLLYCVVPDQHQSSLGFHVPICFDEFVLRYIRTLGLYSKKERKIFLSCNNNVGINCISPKGFVLEQQHLFERL